MEITAVFVTSSRNSSAKTCRNESEGRRYYDEHGLLMATILRRIQQLEHRLAAQAPAASATGARELFIAKINSMAARLRASPDWKGELSPAETESVKARLREYFASVARATSDIGHK